MKNFFIFLALILSFAVSSCSKQDEPQGSKEEVQVSEDCDDKVEDLGKKSADEMINLEDNQDGGCTL